ncbi:MAG TPA: tetratricopeptide repeat protein [Kofleriaceae bacterium]|nr:tetratricopeptide repeat protein [Kofleriaceae bacterium]
MPSYYLFWLLIPTILAVVSAHPSVLLVIVIALVARRWLPDPIDYLRHARRINTLRAQIEVNPANAVARTQLAEIWLAKRRPKRAIPLLEQALERDPTSAELKYLLGLARQRAGQAEAALTPLSEALAKDDRVRYGSAYLAIADALSDLKRDDEAIEAYGRYLKINTSSLEGYTKLVRAHRRKKDEPAARKARDQGLDTWRVLPGFQRRKQLLWWLQLKLGG